MKNFRIKAGKSIYFVKANDSDEALKKVEEYVSDERLSPMTYHKLKEMGYGPEKWKNLTQEQANKIVEQGNNSSKKETKQETPTSVTTKSEQTNTQTSPKEDLNSLSELVKEFNKADESDNDTYVEQKWENKDGSIGISVALKVPLGNEDTDSKKRAKALLKQMKSKLGENYEVLHSQYIGSKSRMGEVMPASATFVFKKKEQSENTNKSEQSETENKPIAKKSSNKSVGTYKGVKVRYNNDDDPEQIKELIDEIQENYEDEGFKKFDFTHGDEYIKIDGRKYTYEDGRLTDYEDEDEFGGYPKPWWLE